MDVKRISGLSVLAFGLSLSGVGAYAAALTEDASCSTPVRTLTSRRSTE